MAKHAGTHEEAEGGAPPMLVGTKKNENFETFTCV